jgi:hypothetical protein
MLSSSSGSNYVKLMTFYVVFRKTHGARVGDDAPFGPIRPVSREISEWKIAAFLRVTECIKVIINSCSPSGHPSKCSLA